MPRDEITLTMIIPTYNRKSAIDNIKRNIASARSTGITVEAIIVDDGSDEDCLGCLLDIPQHNPGVSVVTCGKNLGAGSARNLGWETALGKYTLFFDDDDILFPDGIVEAISVMDAYPEVDVSILTYDYASDHGSRESQNMSYSDQIILERLLGRSKCKIHGSMDAYDLLLFSNYPWNKIIRTKHYKNTKLRFGSGMVNNDMLGHWHVILNARNVATLETCLCRHLVPADGRNLTNLHSEKRLPMFDELRKLYETIDGGKEFPFPVRHNFWKLALRLYAWERSRSDKHLMGIFDEKFSELVYLLRPSDLFRMRCEADYRLPNHLVKSLLRNGSV